MSFKNIDFESPTYSTGDLNGQDGWSGHTSFDVIAWGGSEPSAPTDGGSQGVKGTTDNIAVSFTPTDSTTGSVLHIVARTTDNSSPSRYPVWIQKDASNTNVYGAFRESAACKFVDGSTTATLFTYSADTWYHFEVRMNYSASTYEVRYKTDGGSYSGWTEYDMVTGESHTSSGRYQLAFSTSGTLYVDDFRDTTPPSTFIKTVNGLAKASVKTFNGLAIASVKSINGLT